MEITVSNTEQRLADQYINRTMSFWSGGVEYFGSVIKVFYNPTIQEFQAKCQFYNEPGSYFFKTLDRNLV